MRTAIVHDGFVRPGGAERVVEALVRAFDGSTLHVGGFVPDRVPASLRGRALRGRALPATVLQPLVRRGVPLPVLAPLLPLAFSRLDLPPVDLVISSSAAFAHHVRVPPGSAHLWYVHTPPRFLWDGSDYFHGQAIRRAATAPGRGALRVLDRAAARRVDLFVANSEHVARRVRGVYGRDAVVVYPPVETGRFRPTTERSGRFLVVSRLRNQKRIDLAIQAANLLGAPLDVVGEGPELGRLRGLAGPTVRFLGRLADDEVRTMMATCTAVLVPAVQDFGLSLVEAQASGRPPIAFAEGGALEVVEDGRSGFLFGSQSAEALAAAMDRALRLRLDVAALLESARPFDESTFRSRIRDAAMLACRLHAERLAASTRSRVGARPPRAAADLVPARSAASTLPTVLAEARDAR